MKARIITLIVLVLSLGMLGYTSGQIGKTEKLAEVTETTISGDASNAAGVRLSFGAHAGDRLAWKCTYDFGKKQGDTDFQIYEKSPSILSTRSKPEPEISVANDVWPSWAMDVLNAKTDGTVRKQDEVMSKTNVQFAENAEETARKFTEGITPGEYKYRSVYIKDIFKYYPINYSFTNGTTGSYLNFEEINADPSGEKLQMLRDVNDFFRIPVCAKERVFCKFTVDSGGHVKDMEMRSANESETMYSEANFDLNMKYCNTEDTFYMLFDAHLWFFYGEDGEGNKVKTVDTSKIKDGFGIYKLPWDMQKAKFHTDRLKTVYPLDPSNYYETIEMSPDGKNLLVIARDEQRVWAEVIRISDMKRVQKIDLIKLDGVSDSGRYIGLREISDKEYLIFTNEGQLAVMSFEAGKYHKEISVSGLQTELTSYDVLDYEKTKIVYDGSKLVIAAYASLPGMTDDEFALSLPDDGKSCVAEVAVLDRTGLRYYGRLTSNLLDYNDKASAEIFIKQAKDEETGRGRGFWRKNRSSVTKRCDDMLEITL